MEQIIWTDEFNTGIRQIDKQHRQIINALNKLLKADDVTTDSETVSDILTELTRYTQEHFRDEEELLEKLGYPDLEAHKRQHFAYRKRTVDLCLETMQGFHGVPQKLQSHLRKWWLHHILSEDRKYTGHIKSGE